MSLARVVRTAASSSSRCTRRAYAGQAVAQSSELAKPRLDYRAISENVVYKSHNALNRRAALPNNAIQSVARVYTEHRTMLSHLNVKRNARSMAGERVRKLLSEKQPDLKAKQEALEEAKLLKAEVTELEAKVSQLEGDLLSLALAIPNDTHPQSPLGPESAAVTLSTHGPALLPANPARDHVDVARTLDLIDLEAGATVTGSSWYYLKNEGALLEMALTNYAMSIAVKHGYTPVTTPDVVRSDIARRCGFQPRENAEGGPPLSHMYHITPANPHTSHNQPELILAGTAEIPLAGMFANKILGENALPAKVVGLGRAFRAEAGARGVETRGLYRVHQFTKLELFVVTDEASSEQAMEDMRKIQIQIYEGLGLPFRVLDMPTEELGASAYRKYDMEAWMPGRGNWGEISSTSNCTDYQARRLHIRYRRPTPPGTTSAYPSAGLPFAHTLNGTAAAIPRLIVALLENGARFDEAGNVVGIDLPDMLRPFWVGGSEREIINWV